MSEILRLGRLQNMQVDFKTYTGNQDRMYSLFLLLLLLPPALRLSAPQVFRTLLLWLSAVTMFTRYLAAAYIHVRTCSEVGDIGSRNATQLLPGGAG